MSNMGVSGEFRYLVPHHPAAKADDPVVDVLDRIHDPVPELAVQTVFLGMGGQPRLLYELILKALLPQVLHQIGAVLPREAQAEAAHGLIGELPFLQVLVPDLPVRAAKLIVEEPGRRLVDLQEPGPPVPAPPGLLRPVLLGKRHAGPLRQHPHRLREGVVLIVHHKGVHVSARSAAEAVVHLQISVHGKGGGFLVVERAEPPMAAALFLQPHISRDHFHDIVPRPDLFHNLVRIVHLCLHLSPEPQPIHDFGIYMSS